MGSGGKKEYRSISGHPVLIHCLIPFLHTDLFSQIIITIPKGDHDRVSSLLSDLPKDLHPHLSVIKLAEGGATRQASVLCGLEAVDCDPKIVLIHDGSRPWVSTSTIEEVAAAADRYGACIPIVPSTDAMKQIRSDGIISAHLRRAETVCAQTPQGFGYNDILQAHYQAGRDGTFYIDDSEIYSRYIGDVHTVDGDRENRKITFPADFEITGEEKI